MNRIRWGDAISHVMERLHAEAGRNRPPSGPNRTLSDRAKAVVWKDRDEADANTASVRGLTRAEATNAARAAMGLPPLSPEFLAHIHEGERPAWVAYVPEWDTDLRPAGTVKDLAIEAAGVSQGEVNAAVTTLYGKREGTRKRQRRRYGVTYKQRDEIAQLLLRLFHNGRLPDGR